MAKPAIKPEAGNAVLLASVDFSEAFRLVAAARQDAAIARSRAADARANLEQAERRAVEAERALAEKAAALKHLAGKADFFAWLATPEA